MRLLGLWLLLSGALLSSALEDTSSSILSHVQGLLKSKHRLRGHCSVLVGPGGIVPPDMMEQPQILPPGSNLDDDDEEWQDFLWHHSSCVVATYRYDQDTLGRMLFMPKKVQFHAQVLEVPESQVVTSIQVPPEFEREIILVQRHQDKVKKKKDSYTFINFSLSIDRSRFGSFVLVSKASSRKSDSSLTMRPCSCLTTL